MPDSETKAGYKVKYPGRMAIIIFSSGHHWYVSGGLLVNIKRQLDNGALVASRTFIGVTS